MCAVARRASFSPHPSECFFGQTQKSDLSEPFRHKTGEKTYHQPMAGGGESLQVSADYAKSLSNEAKEQKLVLLGTGTDKTEIRGKRKTARLKNSHSAAAHIAHASPIVRVINLLHLDTNSIAAVFSLCLYVRCLGTQKKAAGRRRRWFVGRGCLTFAVYGAPRRARSQRDQNKRTRTAQARDQL